MDMTTYSTVARRAGQLLFGSMVLGCSMCLGAEIKGTVKRFAKALPDAVVYIGKIEGQVFSPPPQPVQVNQINLTFVPHVAPVLVGTTVTFPNSDLTMHSVFSPHQDKRFDLGTYKAGTVKSMSYDKPGVFVVLCHIHHEMSAYIVVTETPYFAVTNPQGEYSITNVPPGKYKLALWHETMKPREQQIDLSPGKDLVVHLSLPK